MSDEKKAEAGFFPKMDEQRFAHSVAGVHKAIDYAAGQGMLPVVIVSANHREGDSQELLVSMPLHYALKLTQEPAFAMGILGSIMDYASSALAEHGQGRVVDLRPDARQVEQPIKQWVETEEAVEAAEATSQPAPATPRKDLQA